MSQARMPSPAILVAVLALVAAVAGTAFAGTEASTSAINKKKVKKIATKQINKLAPELSVASAESANTANRANTAATANTALNANAVSGVNVRRFSFRAPQGTGPTPILNAGGLRLTADCGPPSTINVDVIARTTVNGATLYSYSIDAFPAQRTVDSAIGENVFNVGESFDLLPEDDSFQVGHTRYTTPGGSLVTLEWMSEDESGTEENICLFRGHAMLSG